MRVGFGPSSEGKGVADSLDPFRWIRRTVSVPWSWSLESAMKDGVAGRGPVEGAAWIDLRKSVLA
jgi:hypothetical protein